MRQYLLRRLVQAVPVVILITMIVFTVMQLTPGNPLSSFVGPDTSPADLAKREKELGLDKPIPIQYLVWIKEVATGNLGFSVKGSRPVAEMMGQRIPPTLLLAGMSVLVSFLVGIPIGVVSALKRYSFTDYSLTIFAFLGLSVPNFFFAIGMIYIFSVKIPLFPSMGMVTQAVDLGGWALFADYAKHLVLPVAVLSLSTIATVVRFTRSGMMEVLNSDYIRTARAKGLSERRVVYKHGLRNALIPVVTIFGLMIPYLFSGSFIVETIFAWPGMGQLGIQSIFARDYPVVMAINLFGSFLVLGGNLMADLLYGLVDPRIRYD